jgi:hypothetical protein
MLLCAEYLTTVFSGQHLHCNFCFALQNQQVELLASLQDKETLLHDLQTKLQESEAKLLAAEKSAFEALHAAEQRYIAIEERTRLSEQVCL